MSDTDKFRTVRVVREGDDADKYRDRQAEQLLREAGFIEHNDGTWHPSEESQP
jgi:hypothetical protein